MKKTFSTLICLTLWGFLTNGSDVMKRLDKIVPEENQQHVRVVSREMWQLRLREYIEHLLDFEDENGEETQNFVRFVYEYKKFLQESKNAVKADLIDDKSSRAQWLSEINNAMLKLQIATPPVVKYLLWEHNYVYISDPETQEYVLSLKNLRKLTHIFGQVILRAAKTTFGVFVIVPVLDGEYYQIENVKTGRCLYTRQYHVLNPGRAEYNDHERLNAVYLTKHIHPNSTYFQIRLAGNDLIEIKTKDGRPVFTADTYIEHDPSLGRKIFISNRKNGPVAKFALEPYVGPKIIPTFKEKMDIQVKRFAVNTTITQV